MVDWTATYHRGSNTHCTWGVSLVAVYGKHFGFYAILAIVLLRLAVGFHFFKEGLAKLKDDGFRSKYFLLQATGPLSEYFHGLVPDRYGELRLDRARTERNWKRFRDRAARTMKLDDDREQADQVLDDYKRKLRTYLSDHRDAIETHWLELERLRQAKQEDTAELRHQWITQQDYKLQAAAADWRQGVIQLEREYQHDLLALGGRRAAGVKKLPDPWRKAWVDHAVTYVVLGVGVLLLLGLFVRLAAVVGGGFLLSVMATQPFWAADANLSYAYYQFVELAALILLFVWGAGRFAGLDFFLSSWWSARQTQGVASQ